MGRSSRDTVAVAAFVTAIAVVVGVIPLSRDRIPVFQSTAIFLGWTLIVVGSALDVWTVASIRRGVAGRVKPLLDRVVRGGPYRHMRHPVYLGMLVILVGVAWRLGSWPGVVAAVLLFLPSIIYRARLEETALEKRFGNNWDDYRLQTGFLLPRVRRRQP